MLHVLDIRKCEFTLGIERTVGPIFPLVNSSYGLNAATFTPTHPYEKMHQPSAALFEQLKAAPTSNDEHHEGPTAKKKKGTVEEGTLPASIDMIAQATSKQMSKHDFIRPYMDAIDNMLLQMMHEDPSFKPAGGRFGEHNMDYDTDGKTMAELRRRLRKAQEDYYRCRSEYMTNVLEALELEDTVKNYEL